MFFALTGMNGLDDFDDLQEAMDNWVNAPWLQKSAVAIGDLCSYYVYIDSWPLCRTALSPSNMFPVRHYLCYGENDLSWSQSGTFADIRCLFVQSKLSSLCSWKSATVILKKLGMDLFKYRTQDEEGYAKRLTVLEAWLVAAWADWVDVDDQEMCLTRLQRAADSRFLKKACSSYR